MSEPSVGRTLSTTQTSLRILELVREHEGLTLAELDDLVDMTKSSLHAHCKTLEKSRYLIEVDGIYQIGLHAFAVSEYARQRRPSFRMAEEIVGRLAEITGEEANFTVLEHGRLVMIHSALIQSSGRTQTINFRREFYLHNTAAGKAILAELSPHHVERILDRWGLPAETDATIANREKLDEALETTAERGYGTSIEEFAEGLVAVGASIADGDGEVVGGLSVGGPKYRLDRSRLHEDLAPDLLSVAAEFEGELEE